MKKKRFVSLLTKFAVMFLIFTLTILVINGFSIYNNQIRIDRETRLEHMQNINTYFDSLITEDGETFLAYQDLMLKYKDEVEVPIDVQGYGEAETKFYEMFYEAYPGKIAGEDVSYYDMPEDLQKQFVVFQHEYWMYMFEQARPDLNVPYTYYVVPTGEKGHVYWMIDAFREPSDTVGEENLKLCTDVLDAPEDGHEMMWYALEKGKPGEGYDTYDNEYGQTYAYYRPVEINGKVRGAVGVEVEIASVNHDILISTIRQVGSMAAILIIAVVILLVYINSRYIREIKNLSGHVKSYAKSKDVSLSVEIQKGIIGNDELTELSDQTANMILELDEHMKNIIATTKELNETKEQAQALDALAKRDALTGIRNKTSYDEEIKKLEWDLADGKGDFGIAIADLNYLKRINDTYGHEKGNVAIKKICNIICAVFVHSPVFRIGGDEFAIILRGHDLEHIDELIAEFRDILLKLSKDESLLPWETVSAAIGYAVFDESIDSTASNIFKRADQAMYEDKKRMKAVRE